MKKPLRRTSTIPLTAALLALNRRLAFWRKERARRRLRYLTWRPLADECPRQYQAAAQTYREAIVMIQALLATRADVAPVAALRDARREAKTWRTVYATDRDARNA